MIGTLNEKSVHKQIKYDVEKDSSKHEVNICGYIADVVSANTIYEIQTKNFNNLRNKIKTYLKNTKCNIEIIYPISIINTINWIEKGTGEVVESNKRKTRNNKFNIFRELYKLRDNIIDDRVSYKIYLLETVDYRYLDGYGPSNKKYATKIDKGILKIIDKITLGSKVDYYRLLSRNLPHRFTSKDFSKIHHCTLDIARQSLLVLYRIGVVDRIGKDGNSIVYILNTDNEGGSKVGTQG